MTGCAEAIPTQTAAPTSTPTATPTASPTTAPTPTATATAAPSQLQLDFDHSTPCADATAVDPEGVDTTPWLGDYVEQLASAQPRVGFEPAGALSTDEVLCSLSYRLPLDGEPAANGHFSVAYVRDASVRAQVEAWATQQGYSVSPEAPSTDAFIARSADELDYVSVVPIVALDLDLERERRVTRVDLQPTDLRVMHRTTVPVD